MLLEFNKISFDYLAGKLTLSINCTKNPDMSCAALSLPVYQFEIQLSYLYFDDYEQRSYPWPHVNA